MRGWRGYCQIWVLALRRVMKNMIQVECVGSMHGNLLSHKSMLTITWQGRLWVTDNRTYGKCLAWPLIHSRNSPASSRVYFKLEINEFIHYEAKIEESEKAGSRQESNSEHLWLELPVLTTEPRQPDNHQPSQTSLCTAQVVLIAAGSPLASF